MPTTTPLIPSTRPRSETARPLVERMRRSGVRWVDIADKLDVSTETLRLWRRTWDQDPTHPRTHTTR